MPKIFTRLLFALFIVMCPACLFAQQNARIQAIQKKLDSLSKKTHGCIFIGHPQHIALGIRSVNNQEIHTYYVICIKLGTLHCFYG